MTATLDPTTLAAEVRARRRELDQLAGEARSIAMRGKSTAEEIATLSAEVALYDKVAGVLNKIGEERQTTAQTQIEALVTRGLQVIFGEELSFHLVQKMTGKTVTVDFVVRSTLVNGRVVETPVLEARGGGLAATVGFLLRLVVMLLSHKPNEVLFLDETFAHVSAEYLDRVSAFLREIVDKTNVQIIMVTHQTELTEQADKVYRFALDSNGITQVSEVG